MTRKELFDLVWAEPMTKLAPKFGLSDVGLAKLCARYDVPRPPAGYWAKVAAGKTGLRPALPPSSDATIPELGGPGRPAETKNDPLVDAALEAEREFVSKYGLKVNKALHPLAKEAKQKLSTLHMDKYGRLQGRTLEGVPDLLLSPATLRWGIALFSQIAHGAEKRGYRLSVDTRTRTTRVHCEQQTVTIRIEEPSRQLPKSEHIEHRFRERGSWGTWENRVIQTCLPQGYLMLRLSQYSAWGKSWKLTPSNDVEPILAELFGRARVAFALQKRSDEIRAREHAAWEAQQELLREEKRAADQLTELASAYQRSLELRQLLIALKESGIPMSHPVGRYESWESWVQSYIDEHDPVEGLRSGRIALAGKRAAGE